MKAALGMFVAGNRVFVPDSTKQAQGAALTGLFNAVVLERARGS